MRLLNNRLVSNSQSPQINNFSKQNHLLVIGGFHQKFSGYIVYIYFLINLISQLTEVAGEKEM